MARFTRDPPRSEKYLYLMENGPVAAGGRLHADRPSGKTARRNTAPVRSGTAGEFDGKRYVDVGNVGNFGFYDSFTLVGVDQSDGGHGRDRQPRAG